MLSSNWLLIIGGAVAAAVSLVSLGAFIAHTLLFEGVTTLWMILIFG